MITNPKPVVVHTWQLKLNHHTLTYIKNRKGLTIAVVAILIQLGQNLPRPTITITMSVPGKLAVDMPYTKLSSTSLFRATSSLGAALAPTSSTPAVAGSDEVAARAVAPMLGCSTRSTTMATTTRAAGSGQRCWRSPQGSNSQSRNLKSA